MSDSLSAEFDVESLAGKYLTFTLGEEIYGIGILKVQEIIGLLPITRVPRVQDYVRGVINLRGKVIPVISLGLRFGLPARDDTARTCIIVVELRSESGVVTMGMVVDSVSEVVNIDASNIEAAPALGSEGDTAFLRGMGKVKDKVVMLLDVGCVVDMESLQHTNGLAAPEQTKWDAQQNNEDYAHV